MSRAKTFRQANRLMREHPTASAPPVERPEFRVVLTPADCRAIDAARRPCRCGKCPPRMPLWPRYYLGAASQISFECWLERHAPMGKNHYDGVGDDRHYYQSTSDSPLAHAAEHARKYGIRIERGCELEPESEAALLREIARAR